jgi:predicted DCC family thiol-disulfide oxidoreductase YuxK
LQKPNGDGAIIVYDGECPFCSSYIHFLRLRETIGDVELVDARQGGKFVEDVFAAGYDLDEGMVLVYRGRYYHGADCMHMIGLLSTPSSIFNRANKFMTRSPRVMAWIYPVLRAGRNATLRMLGRSKIGKSAEYAETGSSMGTDLGSDKVDRLES